MTDNNDLDLVPLTPAQRAEVSAHDPELLEVWINAYRNAPATITSPVGWFLNGIRSGERPPGHRSNDAKRELRIRQAEAWIRNAGIYCTETEMRAELFSDVGGGKGYSGGLLCGLEAELGERMLNLWRTEQPRAVIAEREFLERAARNHA